MKNKIIKPIILFVWFFTVIFWTGFVSLFNLMLHLNSWLYEDSENPKLGETFAQRGWRFMGISAFKENSFQFKERVDPLEKELNDYKKDKHQ